MEEGASPALEEGNPHTSKERLKTSWRKIYRSHATSALRLTSMPVRQPPPNASCSTRASTTASAKSTMAARRWTGWNKSRNAASPSRLPPRPALGTARRTNTRATPSTSSTRPVTSTSPLKSSVPCAFWMDSSPCSAPLAACNRNRKPCGAKPTATAFRAWPTSTKWIAPAPTSTRLSANSKSVWARAPCRSKSPSALKTTSRAWLTSSK